MNFINFTNHPSDTWSEEQIKAAEAYGTIVDLPFPNIDPNATEWDIGKLGDEFVEKIEKLKPCAVLCQGEFTLSYLVIAQLLRRGVTVLSACSERTVKERQRADGSTEKVSTFQFVKFRTFLNRWLCQDCNPQRHTFQCAQCHIYHVHTFKRLVWCINCCTQQLEGGACCDYCGESGDFFYYF